MVYTNGILITNKVAGRLAELGNCSPAISQEGWKEEADERRGSGVFDKVMAAIDRLRERGSFSAHRSPSAGNGGRVGGLLHPPTRARRRC
ncbi:MAG: hypothetical protein IMX00_01980 [Limnochordales bacterium]|nr:hypothetical protein [Limnochordales bacterium]